MSWVRIWVHPVFTTKNREPLLQKNIRNTIFQHIKENASLKDIHIDSINGYTDHCHCLISLNSEQSIAEVAQLIKGESAFWINKNKLVDGKFYWQNDFYAASVSEKHLSALRKYIWNQEKHHQKNTYLDEMKIITGFYAE